MIWSFHFPPTAAIAAVIGQSLIGFSLRAWIIVTSTCLLARLHAWSYYRPPGGANDRRQRGNRTNYSPTRGDARLRALLARRRHVSDGHSGAAGSAGRTARLRLRVRRVEDARLAARAPVNRLEDVGPLRRHARREKGLERAREHGRARGHRTRRAHRRHEPQPL